MKWFSIIFFILFAFKFVECNELCKNKFDLEAKTLSKTEAEYVDGRENETAFNKIKIFFRRIFTLNPINNCKSENCEFCCLSLNFCGSKKQCEKTSQMLSILRILFFIVCFVLISFLIYKIYITDGLPEQLEFQKIGETQMNNLIGVFMQNKENRKKMKP
jgi:hypothetical protein